MDQQETLNSTEAAVLTQAIWETLTPVQQETVLQTLVRICCQIIDQRMWEVGHESSAE
jgi:hypothetical protein